LYRKGLSAVSFQLSAAKTHNYLNPQDVLTQKALAVSGERLTFNTPHYAGFY
jgi:hypothetical protein